MLSNSDLSCFSVFGGSNFMIASVLQFVGRIPFGLILYPSHVISVTANLPFLGLLLGFRCIVFSVL